MKSSVLAGLMLGGFVFASASVLGSQSLIATGAVWRFLDNGSDQGAAWQQLNFNDTDWRSGAAQLGYGDGDEVTVIGPTNSANRPITYYFRRAFSVTQVSSFSNLVVRLLRDDGGVVYLNGVEVFRSNMPNGPVSYNTLAVSAVGGTDESTFYSAAINSSPLVEGANVLAVEIHQSAINSSDVSFDLALEADGAPPVELPVISVIATDAAASEVNPNSDRPTDPGAFRITRSGPTNDTLHITYALNGTAVNGSDYVRLPGSVDFAPGVTAIDVLIEILDDAEVEGTETIRVSITGPPCPANPPPGSGCYRIAQTNEAVISILDDEPANQPPTVALTAPSDGAEFIAPTNVTLIASGNDPDGYWTLKTVEFFQGTHSLGIRTNAPVPGPFGPFVLIWQVVTPGDYILTGVATDDHGAKATSGPVHITVRGQTNVPVVNIIATDASASEVNPNSARPPDPGAFRITRSGPTDNSLHVTYALNGTALNGVDYAQLPGFVDMAPGVAAVDVVVEILDDSEVEGTETIQISITGPPCPVNPPPDSGCYRIGQTNLVVISIADDEPANRPPTVTLATPSDGAEFTAPTNITLIAQGNDPDGYETLKTVQFFEGTHSLGIRTNYPTMNPIGPFVLSWQNVQAGQYILTAVATDDHGAKATSAPVHITVHGGETNVPVTLISMGAVWKYLDNGSDQVTAWREADYDDSAWATGQAQLGYGDGDERTVVSYGGAVGNKYITTYFRKHLDVANAGSITTLRARLLEDDGAAVYVNGVEVFRSNLPQGPVSYTTLATVAVENQLVEFSLSPGVLVDGANVIAVEMHQANVTSSDLSFDFELIGNGGSGGSELPTVGVYAADAHASERPTNTTNNTADTGELVIWREGNKTDALTVFYALTGSARNGIDYDTLSESAVIPAGADAVHLIVRPIDDSLVEGDETVVLQLQSNAAYRFDPNLSYPPSATVVIADDDPTMTNEPPYVQLNSPRNGDVFRSATNIELVAYAQDREDSYDVTVEFFAGTHSLGFGIFNPTRCATPYCPNFALTWTNPPVGQYSLTAKATDKSGASSVSAPVNIFVEGESSGERELHVVGVYEGNQGSSLIVNRPGKRVTLFLSSYEGVHWDVTVGDGTIVERIFLSGYYRQQVSGAAGAQIISMSFEDNAKYIYLGYSLDSGVFYQGLPRVCALTGMEIASFQGGYHAPSPIFIDSVQDDERLRCNYPQPTPLSELPDLSFRLYFYDGGIPGNGRVFSRRYTLGGPDTGGRLLPAPRVIMDSRVPSEEPSDYYYGAERQDVFKINSQTGVAESMQLPPELPELSWPMGVAFDSSRDQILLATLGGEGYLYGYAPSNAQWSLVSTMNNLDVDCIEYHASLDRLYAVKVSHIDYGDNTLWEFSPDGMFLREIPLPITPYDIGPIGYHSELVSVGDYLVLLEERQPWFYSGYELSESRIYLIDPRTSQVWLTYRKVVEQDADGDGVPDSRDHCQFLPPGAVVNENGCSIAQLCPCDGGWETNADYVRCVIDQSWKFYRAGLISAEERRSIIAEAAQSNCGPSDGSTCLMVQPQQGGEIQRDGVCFVVSGASGTCVLECSTDLINWRPIQTVTIPSTSMEVADPTANQDSARFYRLRLQ